MKEKIYKPLDRELRKQFWVEVWDNNSFWTVKFYL